MRIMLITTPIRPVPTHFPPMGCLSIINYLRRQGVDDVEFHHIDGNRPSYQEALARILEYKPDVLGISAVVSTAYAYTKRISLDVKKALPDTLIVVGGNLAASSEVLLRRTGAGLCVLGEGERVFLNIVRRAGQTREPTAFADIPGLMLLDAEGRLINTGFEDPLPAEEVYDLDWSDLGRATDLDIYLPKVEPGDSLHDRFSHDPRAHQPQRHGRRAATIDGSKGCVARCTFCHRWDKGIRYIPVEVLERRIRELVEKFDVGYLFLGDENFGTNRRWLQAFCDMIKPFDLLWRVGGMRVNCVTPEQIAMMKDAGCVSILYGMETGSERMLQVMEKKVRIEDNCNAMRWTLEAGLPTVVQLVIGMPGESPETIGETAAFCKWAMSLSPDLNPNDMSINYAQALPGTPLYEFGRRKGLIPTTLDGEEEYLLRVSDKDAHDEVTTLNFTDYPRLVSQTWRPWITAVVNYEYVRKYGLDHYRRKLLADGKYFAVKREASGYHANPKRLVESCVSADFLHKREEAMSLDGSQVPSLASLLRERKLGLALICYPVLAYRFRHFLVLLVLLKNLQNAGLRRTLGLLTEYFGFRMRGHRLLDGHRSLRKVVFDDLKPPTSDAEAMLPLRKGR